MSRTLNRNTGWVHINIPKFYTLGCISGSMHTLLSEAWYSMVTAMVATWLNLNWSIEINFILKRPFLLVQVLLLKHCCYMLWSFHHSLTPVNHCYANYPCLLLMYEGVFSLYLFNVLAPKQPKKVEVTLYLRWEAGQYVVMLCVCPVRRLWTAPWIPWKLSSTQRCSVTGKPRTRSKSSRWELPKPRFQGTYAHTAITPAFPAPLYTVCPIWSLKSKFYLREINISATQTW